VRAVEHKGSLFRFDCHHSILNAAKSPHHPYRASSSTNIVLSLAYIG
jgi:hypothetical protein